VGKALTSTLDLQEVLTLIMGKISELLRPSTWSLLLLDDKKQELHFQIAIGRDANKIRDFRIKIGEGLAGWVAKTGEAAIVNDVTKDVRFSKSIDGLIHPNIKTVVCVPLKSKDRTLGVIELINCFEDRFPSEDLSMLTSLADYAAIAIENATYVKRIQELTITDDATRLYNARHLQFVLDTELYRSRRYGYALSVVFLDLDHFKQVNDSHGHLAGSRLLWLVGDLLRSHLRLIDTAFRYGGDEFVLVLPQTSKEQARQVVERLRAMVAERSFVADEGVEARVTASFGIATFPEDGDTKKDLFARADEAMYAAKSGGRNAVRLSTPSAPSVA